MYAQYRPMMSTIAIRAARACRHGSDPLNSATLPTMDWRTRYADKVTTVEEAVRKIQPGRRILEHTGGSTSRAAEIFGISGISPRTIQYRLHAWGRASDGLHTDEKDPPPGES